MYKKIKICELLKFLFCSVPVTIGNGLHFAREKMLISLPLMHNCQQRLDVAFNLLLFSFTENQHQLDDVIVFVFYLFCVEIKVDLTMRERLQS